MLKRKFFFTAVLFLTALVFCTFSQILISRAYADAVLYRGSNNIGAVQTVENNSGILVPVEDVGRLLGFSASRSGDELLLTRGSTQLRIINNSAAAWSGFSIVPLMSAPVYINGKFWIETSSAVTLFQSSIGSGANNRLRFNKISGYTLTAANADSNEIDFGRFDEEPKIEKSAINTAPQLPTVANLPSVPVQTSQNAAAHTKSSASNSNSNLNSNSNSTQPSKNPQPKYETFKLTDSKTEKGESYSGTIQGIRWSVQEGTHKKIRAVIMADDNADPMTYMSGKALHLLFASTIEASENLASPFSNVKTELKRNAKGFEFILKPERITKAEKIILSNPRRVVVEFTFPSNVNIVRTTPEKTQSQTVAQVQTPAPARQSQTSTTTKSKTKSDPVIKIDNTKKTPAVAAPVPQDSITIPMNKTAAQTSGRKTIVIDPGHGGKDPGASDNGVVEKNVNLGIGLELEKVLQARGYNVVMTRRTDVYLKLQERTDIANNVNADLFVSIHVNALPSKKSMTGFEIYIMALPTDKDAMNLAKIENREYVEGKGMDSENVDRRTEMLLRILGDMQQNNKISESTDFAAALYNAGVRNSLPMRRVAQAPFFVLRGAGMPAVLLETGFVTNAAESKKLTTSAYQQQIARAMSEGIMNYLR